MAYDLRQYAGGAVATTLVGGTLSSGGSSITMAASTGWPTGSGNFVIVMNRGNATEEKILCSSLSGTTITVAGGGRGYDGTSAASHLVGEKIELCASSIDFSEANATAHETLGAVTTAGDMLYATGANALARLAAGTSGQVLIGGTTPAFTGSPSITQLTTSGNVTATGSVTGLNVVATGMTGAANQIRLVGRNASGAPGSGTFSVGDAVINSDGTVWVCTTGGTPGTWTNDVAALVSAKGDILVATGSKAITNLAVGSNTQVLTADSTQASGVKWAAVASPAMTQLARSVLGSNGTFSFTSISGSYNSLVIKGLLRSATAATQDPLQVRFNNDSGTNYQVQNVTGIGGTASAQELTGQTAVIATNAVIANSATASYATAVEIWVPEYATTTFFKSCLITIGGNPASSTTGAAIVVGGSWANTAAITRIDLGAAAFGNFLTGSTLTLYGVA